MYNYFGYNPQYNQGYQQGYQQAYQSGNDERIWVENETQARSYLVAPNSFVRLWDAQKPVFYEKRTDSAGRPYPMEAYTYSKKPADGPKTEDNTKGDKVLDERLKTLEMRLYALERKEAENARLITKSNDVTSGVQSFSADVQRQSEGGSAETSCFGTDEPVAVE